MAQTLSRPRVESSRPSPGARIRLALLTLLLALMAIIGFKLWRASLIYGSLVDRAKVLSLSQGATVDSFSSTELSSQLSALAEDLHSLRSELGPIVYAAPLGAWLPDYGQDAAQAPALLDYGEKLVDGASQTARLFSAVSSEMDEGKTTGLTLGTAALDALKRHSGDIQESQSQLALAENARSNIDTVTLSSRTRAQFDRIDRLLPIWSAGLNALQAAPEILGANGPRVYLLLVQNSDELRPTGGFISSVLRVRIDNGDLSTLDFSDSYAVENPQVDHPDPPAPLTRYMEAGTWGVRDGNWSPDFPTAARDIEQLYKLDRGVASDGVIAVDLRIVPKLLEAVGPVTVEGYPERVDSGNAIAKLQEYWSSPQGQGQTGDWWQHRKDFSGQLLASLLEHIRTGDFDRLQFTRVMFDALTAKDMLIYVNDPGSEAKLQAAGWAGQLRGEGGDRLMIVDANVGFNKVDPSVDRKADYSVELDSSGGALSKLTLSYSNRSPDIGVLCVHTPYYPPTYAELEQGCYWDYLRIVASPESRLLTVPPGLEAGTDDPLSGRSLFHGFLVLPRGATRKVEFNYQTPHLLRDGKTFRLLLENQPGAPPRQFHVTLKLPEDWIDFAATPAPQTLSAHSVEYELTLDRDFQIVVQKRENSPLGLSIGLGLGGFSLICAGLLVIRRNRRGERSAAINKS